MASQYWTILTVIGATLPKLRRELAHFAAVRTSTDPSGWSATEWPESVRTAANILFDGFGTDASKPPVIYHARLYDGWSSFGELFRFIPMQPPTVATDSGELWHYPLPDRGQLLRRIRRARHAAQYPETRWLANIFEDAATAHRPLFPQSMVLIHRQALGPSLTDDEILSHSRAD